MGGIIWRIYLAVVVVVGQYYFVSAYGATPTEWIPTAIAWSALPAVLIGLLVHRPARPFGWWLVAASVLLYLAGDAVYAGLEDDGPLVPFPSLADWCYLASYPALLVGLVLVARRTAAGVRPAWVPAIAGVGSAAAVFGVLWQTYAGAYLDDPFLQGDQTVVALAYPVLDALLVGVVVWALARRATPSLLSIGAAALALTVGNAVFNVQTADLSFAPAGVAELGWLAFTTFLGVAALHPSMATRSRRGQPDGLSVDEADPDARLTADDERPAARELVGASRRIVAV